MTSPVHLRGTTRHDAQIAMKHGRLVKLILADTEPGAMDPRSELYIVAVEDPSRAVDIVKGRLARDGDQVEAVARVSKQLLEALSLQEGEFIRT